MIFKKKFKNVSHLFNNRYLIVINSFSKNFHLQGLRLGAILASDKLIEKFEAANPGITVKHTHFPYADYRKKVAIGNHRLGLKRMGLG